MGHVLAQMDYQMPHNTSLASCSKFHCLSAKLFFAFRDFPIAWTTPKVLWRRWPQFIKEEVAILGWTAGALHLHLLPELPASWKVPNA